MMKKNIIIKNACFGTKAIFVLQLLEPLILGFEIERLLYFVKFSR